MPFHQSLPIGRSAAMCTWYHILGRHRSFLWSRCFAQPSNTAVDIRTTYKWSVDSYQSTKINPAKYHPYQYHDIWTCQFSKNGQQTRMNTFTTAGMLIRRMKYIGTNNFWWTTRHQVLPFWNLPAICQATHLATANYYVLPRGPTEIGLWTNYVEHRHTGCSRADR